MCVQNNSWDSNFESNLSMFQDEYKIPVTKQVDTNTWMALLTSKGNPDRPAKACDCATVLNSQQAEDLKKCRISVCRKVFNRLCWAGNI